MTIVHVYGAYVPTRTEGISANVHGLCSAQRAAGLDARLDCVPADLEGLNRRRTLLSSAWQAARCVRRARADTETSVVHHHVSLASTAAPAAWFPRQAGAGGARSPPVLVHAWNAFYAATPATRRLPRGDRVAHRVANGPEATAFALRRSKDVVVSSRYQAAQLAALGFRGRTHVVPNGIDLRAHRPRTPEESERARAHFGLDGDPVLLYYGHASPWKGLRVLLEALPFLVREHPRAQVLLSLTSYGTDRALLRDALRAQGLEGRVRIVGTSDVALLHAAADLAVLPAPAAVGSACYPNVLLECLAGGVPLVATAVGGIPEVVHDGRTGLLAVPGDPGSLARRLLELAEDPQLRRRLAAQARTAAEAESGWDRAARAMLAVYRSMGVDLPHVPKVAPRDVLLAERPAHGGQA